MVVAIEHVAQHAVVSSTHLEFIATSIELHKRGACTQPSELATILLLSVISRFYVMVLSHFKTGN